MGLKYLLSGNWNIVRLVHKIVHSKRYHAYGLPIGIKKYYFFYSSLSFLVLHRIVKIFFISYGAHLIDYLLGETLWRQQQL